MTLDITKRLDGVERAVRACRDRLASIDDSKKHYLKTRVKSRNKMMTRGRLLVRKLERLEKILGNTMLSREGRDGRKTMVMFTQYERIKLKRMLAQDDRLTFHCSSEEAEILRSIIDSHRANDKKLGGT